MATVVEDEDLFAKASGQNVHPKGPAPKEAGEKPPVKPKGTNDRGPEWDRAEAEIKAKSPRKENQSARAKIIQKSVYLSAAEGALNVGLPQTATALAACSKPLSQAWDRAAKNSSIVDRMVSMVEGTQSDTAILIGLHLTITAAFALESGIIQKLMERNTWLQNHPAAQASIATSLALAMTLPEKLLVRADVESENLDEAVNDLVSSASNLMVAQQAQAQQAQEAYARAH